MPVTPFHFGPGLLLHAAAPRHVSLVAFAIANIIIDFESAYFLLTGGWPVHRALHTLALGPVVGLFAGALTVGIWRALKLSFAVGAPTMAAGLIGGFLGGLTHALLDGIMHVDMRPLWPRSAANPLLGRMDLATLHLFCLATGAVGGLMLIVRAWLRSARA